MTATVARQNGGDAFETIRYQDCDLKIEPIAIPAGVQTGPPVTVQILSASAIETKIEPEIHLVKQEIGAKTSTNDITADGKCFYCSLCGKSFKEAGNLRRHKDTVHEKLRNFSCQDCGKSFGEAGNLRRHKETVHDKVKNFYCKDCGKAFGEAGNLRRHKETVHDRVKNFACHCGKTFAERGNLKRHAESVHSSAAATTGKIIGVKKTVVTSFTSIPTATAPTSSSSSTPPHSSPVNTPMHSPIAYQEASQQTVGQLTTTRLQPIQEPTEQTQYCTVTTIIPVVTCIPSMHALSSPEHDQQLSNNQHLPQQLHIQSLAHQAVQTSHEMINAN